jgi:protein gp37
MAETTIEWTHRRIPRPFGRSLCVPGYTFNIVWGCVKVSEECRDCYAETIASHYGFDVWGPTKGRRTFGEAYWARPLTWNRQAERQGYRRLVFCSSMADTYEDHPVTAMERQKLWPLIEATPWLQWLLLTKRPQNILEFSAWRDQWPSNVSVGTSIGTSKHLEERLSHLVLVPVDIHLVSCEPLLEALDLSPWLPKLQWIIVGGESGKRARPMHPDWARVLRDQCQEASVAYYFKQWGGRYHQSGGRLLDGRTWDEMPEWGTP